MLCVAVWTSIIKLHQRGEEIHFIASATFQILTWKETEMQFLPHNLSFEISSTSFFPTREPAKYWQLKEPLDFNTSKVQLNNTLMESYKEAIFLSLHPYTSSYLPLWNGHLFLKINRSAVTKKKSNVFVLESTSFLCRWLFLRNQLSRNLANLLLNKSTI